ncbi:DUF4258 domain-containing protein [Rubrobacter aplysinae]|uniref:DUF4258 domain-containing protein n=1 Tax=Rubrobacter aplysinae TaxID=909625 RepID=UPI00389AD6D6
MRISLSSHARRRMNERNVSLEDIENVLSGRGRSHPSQRKRTQRGRSLGGRALEVVYTESMTGQFHIVTVKVLDR